MKQHTVMLDPSGEHAPAMRPRLAPPAGLHGRTVGLLDISKPRGEVFLDRLQTLLAERGTQVRRYAKPTFAKPAPTALAERIASECEVVVEALAD